MTGRNRRALETLRDHAQRMTQGPSTGRIQPGCQGPRGGVFGHVCRSLKVCPCDCHPWNVPQDEAAIKLWERIAGEIDTHLGSAPDEQGALL